MIIRHPNHRDFARIISCDFQRFISIVHFDPNMRILQLHCDSIEYTPTKKEIKAAEEISYSGTTKIEEVVVGFISVESDDNLDVAKNAISQIMASMDKINCKRLLLYPYAHLSSNLARPSLALKVLRAMRTIAIESGIEASSAPFGWTKSYNLKVKGHPLAESSKTINADSHTHAEEEDDNTSDALKEESKLRSYWKIMTPDGIMTDVADFDFSKHKKLEMLAKYESKKERRVDSPPPHVALMKRLAIADYESASDSGNMRFFPNGRLIKSLIERYVTKMVKRYGGYEVETPIMYDSDHPSMVSYFNRFPARQYNIDSEGKRLFLRFAACFGQFLMAHQFQMSYKNLPYRLYELTRYSFRREQSGEIVGLRRLRAFTMPDCHAFCNGMKQATDELKTRFHLSQHVLNGLGIDDNDYEMAIRFTESFYNENKETVKDMVAQHGKPVLVEMWKDKFFYFVLKWEFNFIDEKGKASALSTDQIDIENGRRYDIEFIDENNKPVHPIILHNSPSGAIERIIYVLLEKADANSKRGIKPQLPLWLSPTQVRIIPLQDEFNNFCTLLADRMTAHKLRVDIDDRNETIRKRIRDAEKEWIRYIIVIGSKEANSTILSVRDRSSGTVRRLTFQEFISEITAQTHDMPIAELNTPRELSRRPQLMV